MIRFTALALACLLALPAQADGPITIYSEYNTDGSCSSLRCFGMELLREAYRRGEIREVHFARQSECSYLNAPTAPKVKIPCTYDHNDYYRPN